MVDFKKLLGNANKTWSKAKKRVAEAEPAFQEFEDGRYEARLVGAKLMQSNAGNTQIDWSWKFLDGQYEGKVKHSYQQLMTEDNLYYLGRDLERMGYELPDDLTQLPEILADIEKSKPVGSITLKTNGDFQNVYIRKMYTADEEEEAEEETEEEESDEDTEDESEEEPEDEESEEEAEEEESEEEEAEEEEEETEDEEEGDDTGEEVEIHEGMKVSVETVKGRETGKIIEILEKEEKVKVRLDSSGKVVRVAVDDVEVEMPEEEEEEEEPAKKPAKKPAPAPAKKPIKKSAPVKKPVKKPGRR